MEIKKPREWLVHGVMLVQMVVYDTTLYCHVATRAREPTSNDDTSVTPLSSTDRF